AAAFRSAVSAPRAVRSSILRDHDGPSSVRPLPSGRSTRSAAAGRRRGRPVLMTTPSSIVTAAETIDGLTSLDLPRRGAIPALHAEARRLGGEPLPPAAAPEVLARTPAGAVVPILPGLPGLPLH